LNRIFRGLVLVFVFSVWPAYAQTPSKATSIPRSGDTTLAARAAGFDVKIVISTFGAKEATKPFSSGYVAKSYVDRIGITVNRTEVIVPHTVFCDLFDVHQAEIQLKGKTGVLTLKGADAAESYWVKIEFNREQVKRKSLGPSIAPGTVTEETTYRVIVVK
jgi:hypothetical protein